MQSQVHHYGPPLSLRHLQQTLGPDVLAELKRLMHRDSQIDAQAIRAWREQNNIEPLGQQLP